MLDDLLDLVEKKFKGKQSRYRGRPGHGRGHGHGHGYAMAPDDPRGPGGLRSLVSQALDSDFNARGHGTRQSSRWHADSSDDDRDHDFRRASGRNPLRGWDD
jgi:hypothetical protein